MRNYDATFGEQIWVCLFACMVGLAIGYGFFYVFGGFIGHLTRTSLGNINPEIAKWTSIAVGTIVAGLVNADQLQRIENRNIKDSVDRQSRWS